MPYRITQCYLPPDRGENPAFTPSRSRYSISYCVLLLTMLHVAWSVCLFVCWAHGWAAEKKAEPIEMPIGRLIRVGPRHHVLDGGSDPMFPCSPKSAPFRGWSAPPYLSDYCVPAAGVDTRQHLRFANRQLLAVPRYRLNTYGRRAFSVAGPTVWNSLPDFIRDPTISEDLFARY